MTETPVGDLQDQRIAILGLGLMGGSLAMALRGQCAELLGIDPDPAVRLLAEQKGIVDRTAEAPADLLSEATLLILAAPVRAILSVVIDLPSLHPGNAVVLDLGSTKVEITNAMQALPERLSPVGGHPMCGKESNSLAQAESSLYRDAVFALTALPNSSPEALRLAAQLVETVGARPFWLDPITHDRWVAATSHLPYLLANALAAITPEDAAPLIGPGYRSTARLAPSSRTMMLDILSTNQENILPCLQAYQGRLQALEFALATGDFSVLLNLLEEGALMYETLLSQSKWPKE